MTRNIDYLTRLVALLETVKASENEIVTREKYYNLVGPRYNIIVNELHYNQIIMEDDSYGVRRVVSWDSLETYLEDMWQELNDALEDENRKNTEDRYKIKGIIYGKISLIISGLTSLLSLWVTLRQVGIF